MEYVPIQQLHSPENKSYVVAEVKTSHWQTLKGTNENTSLLVPFEKCEAFTP